jgi:ribosomal protein L25 (general stress protein Ctc)
VPTIFVAVTVNVYSVSDDNSVNVDVLVDAFVVANKLSGDPVIVYPVIGLLPSELGTLQETTQSILVPVEIGVSTIVVNKLVGEEGTVGVVTVRVAGTEFPIIFTAVTVNVYNVSGDNGVNVNVLVDAFVLPDKLSGDPVIVYPVIAVPPLEVGTLQETVQSQLVLEILVILVVKSVGEEGGVGVVTVTVAGKEGPALFEAVTVNVYSVLTNNPVNVNVVIDPSVVPDKLPGDPVIVYPVIVSPPELGALQETVQSQLVLDILVILVVKSVGEEGTGSVLANNDRVRAVC